MDVQVGDKAPGSCNDRPMRTCIVVAFLALGAGCKAKLGGDLTVDGKPFTLDSCRSGQAFGFSGVDLLDPDGKKLRLVVNPNGTGAAIVFPPGATVGEEVGPCGPLTVTAQNSTINSIKNVEGSATLDCTRGAHAIKGSVTFENCH